jgi:hypothetical protein
VGGRSRPAPADVHPTIVDATAIEHGAVPAQHRGLGHDFDTGVLDQLVLAIEQRGEAQTEFDGVPARGLDLERGLRIHEEERDAARRELAFESRELGRVTIRDRAVDGDEDEHGRPGQRHRRHRPNPPAMGLPGEVSCQHVDEIAVEVLDARRRRRQEEQRREERDPACHGRFQE